ncbi:MAG: hypothetical protein ABI370_08520 [Gammaproteobacteria bacterium]
MNKLFLLKILKAFFHIGKKVFLFSIKVVLLYLSGDATTKRINAQRKWSDDYDVYAASVNKQKNW